MSFNSHTPEALGDLLKSNETINEFIARCDREYRLDPENSKRLGVCYRCGTSLGDTDEDKVMRFGGRFIGNTCCKPCAEDRKEQLRNQERQNLDSLLANAVPPAFRIWDSKIGNNAALAATRSRFSITENRGVILYGKTGQCKTRITWELIKSLEAAGKTWCMLKAYDAATVGIPKEAYFRDFLFIDDLGNEPKSTRFESGLLSVVSHRLDWHRSTTITTQYTDKELKERFFEGKTADALIRRVTERSVLIDTHCSHT